MDEALRAVFDAGEAVVIRVRHELEPHQQRLLAALGAGYVVDDAALPCPRQCGRQECAVSTPARTNERVAARGLGMASLGSNGHSAWEPNWIDFRSSVANVERRRDVGEVPATCDGCGCETDITPAPHSPKCPTLTRDQWTRAGMLEAVEAWAVAHDDQPPAASDWTRETTAHPAARQAVIEFGSFTGFLEEAGFSANTPRRRGRRLGPPAPLDGRELLDRMDAGEPLNDDKAGLEEASEPVGAGAGASSSPKPDVEAAQTPAASVDGLDPFQIRRRRRKAYTRDEVETALRRFHDENGRAPVSADIADHAYLPSTNGAVAAFGAQCWADVIEAMGWPRPTKGTRRAKTSEREPQAEEDAAGPTEPAPERPVSPSPGQAGDSASRSEPPKWLPVPGTGLRYRDTDEALAAADEIEADGQRVAEQAAADGNDQKAAMAAEASRQLAEKIRAAAENREPTIHETIHDEPPAASDFATSNDVEKPEEPMRLLVTPDDMPPFQRAIARSLIAGMRAAADALEQELA